MEVEGLRRMFFFRQGKSQWTEAGVIEGASFLSDEGTTEWGFTGTMTGLFAVNHGSGHRIPAWFDFFEIELVAHASSCDKDMASLPLTASVS